MVDFIIGVKRFIQPTYIDCPKDLLGATEKNSDH